MNTLRKKDKKEDKKPSKKARKNMDIKRYITCRKWRMEEQEKVEQSHILPVKKVKEDAYIYSYWNGYN